LAGTGLPAAADSGAVGPNQYFNGAVAAHEVNAVLSYNCDYPPNPAPVPIDATLSTQGAQAAGFTGTAATSIDVTMTLTSRTSVELGTLTAYDTSFTVPIDRFGYGFCTFGSGVITFTPEPSSPTAQPSTVKFWTIAVHTP
jgi:hypothetical protein